MSASFVDFARARARQRRAVKQAAKAEGTACNVDCLLAVEDVCHCDCNGTNHGTWVGKVVEVSKSGGVLESRRINPAHILDSVHLIARLYW